MRLKFGEPCPKCGTEVVRISRETLNELPEYLYERLKTISKAQKNGKRKFIPVCPRCDAYSLGIEFKPGASLILKDGREVYLDDILDMLWLTEGPFRSQNFKTKANSKISEKAAKEEDDTKIIPFPKYTPPEIDWDEIEEIRNSRYPKLPVEAIQVLKQMMASRPNSPDATNGNYYFEIHSYSNDIYPPESIPIIPGKASTIWIMDLLDRYGGTIDYGHFNCKVERDEVRHPVFSIQEISEEQFSGMNDCLEDYEYYADNKYWRVFSKDLSNFNLAILFAKDLSDEARIFQGMFDNDTFHILWERLIEGKQTWDEILLID